MDRELGREFNGSTGCCARIKTYIQILNTQVKCQTWWHTPATPVLSIKDRWIPVGQEGFLSSQNVSKDKVENKREDTKSHLCGGMLATFPHTHIHARMHAHKHTCILHTCTHNFLTIWGTGRGMERLRVFSHRVRHNKWAESQHRKSSAHLFYNQPGPFLPLCCEGTQLAVPSGEQ